MFMENHINLPYDLLWTGLDAIPTSRAQPGIELNILCLMPGMGLLYLHASPSLKIEIQRLV
jgi:hypothetical protein